MSIASYRWSTPPGCATTPTTPSQSRRCCAMGVNHRETPDSPIVVAPAWPETLPGTGNPYDAHAPANSARIKGTSSRKLSIR